ncbi:MAG: carbohydrate ABC transporter permease [Spirochaetota bacterium]
MTRRSGRSSRTYSVLVYAVLVASHVVAFVQARLQISSSAIWSGWTRETEVLIAVLAVVSLLFVTLRGRLARLGLGVIYGALLFLLGYPLGGYLGLELTLLVPLLLVVCLEVPRPFHALVGGFAVVASVLSQRDVFAGVILPYAAFPLGIFFFRQYAVSLPRDYLDAGRIDGCTEYGLFFRIMAPLMLPAYGAMAILLARKEWNNFVWPLVVLRTGDMFTLPIGLASQIDPYGTGFQVLLPGAVLAILPPVVVFVFGQKYFVSGLTIGGIKG